MLTENQFGDPGQPELRYYFLPAGLPDATGAAKSCLLAATVLRYRTDLSAKIIERKLTLAFPLTASHTPDWSAAAELDANALQPGSCQLAEADAEVNALSRNRQRWERSLREWLQTHGTIPLWKNEFFGLVSAHTEPFEAFQQRVQRASHARKLSALEGACDKLEQLVSAIATDNALNGKHFSQLRRFLNGSRDRLAHSFQETKNTVARLQNDISQCDTMARIGTQMFACRPTREHMHVVILGLGWPETSGSGAGD